MPKHDQDARSPLAQAVRESLAGGLEPALHAARSFFMRHPGDEDAKRVVEALELSMAQVWLGGAEDGADARFADAAQLLARGDLDAALARYEGIVDGDAGRASRIALAVRVVQAAAAGEPLPARPPVDEAVFFEDTTRVAGEGELPLEAFAMDEADADADEPTRMMVLSGYELVDEVAALDDAERTRILAPHVTAPMLDATREVTRIAGVGELPLEELKREMEEDAARDLDALLDSMDGAPLPPRPEPSLALDITVEDLEGAAPVVGSRSDGVSATRTTPQAGPRRSPDPLAPRAARVTPLPELSRDPVHAPLESHEIGLSPQPAWEIREPGAEPSADPTSPLPPAERTWTGMRAPEHEPATFEPGAEPVEADSWAEEPPPSPEREAEALIARGELAEGLRLYRALAAERPDEPHLWERVAELARLLQRSRE